jgi:[NiFe] hydrogenase diaphorase moiety large subunit
MPEPSSDRRASVVQESCARFDHDPTRLMDILWSVQRALHCIDTPCMQLLAEELGSHRVVIEGMVSFYAFFSEEPRGRLALYLCDDIIDRHAGTRAVAEALSESMGVPVGGVSEDGLFSLDLTPCIGLSDQAPALLVNGTPITRVTVARARKLIALLRQDADTGTLMERLGDHCGDGNNAHPLIHSMVHNNLRQPGPVLFGAHPAFSGLQSALQMDPEAIIATIETAGLRGRGGAGFPTARKWQLTRATPAQQRYLICNADEGEPGTFKDRLLLTEKADLLIEGMLIAARAIGCVSGIIYLRAEYAYLHNWLEDRLQAARDTGWLGRSIGGIRGFDFDLRIQSGAGAYICGEESALISSCEGQRGEPKNRPPFPAQRGYLGQPTCVDNVETLCCVARILREGSPWFRAIGSPQSSGTKLFSLCGDCARPGVYELPFGVPVSELLERAGATETGTVLVGGPSGQFISESQFDRPLCFEDLPTGGAVIIFNQQRNLLEVVNYYLDFFIEESCGYCTPCRVGTVFLKKRMEKVIRGTAEPSDLHYLQNLGQTMKHTSRCGLGQTAPNPVLSSIRQFPMIYSALLKPPRDGQHAFFDIQAALEESRHLAKRRSMIYDPRYED